MQQTAKEKQPPNIDLSKFVIEQVLRHSEFQNRICLWGNFSTPQKAVLVLKPKLPKNFTPNTLLTPTQTNSNNQYTYLTAKLLTDCDIELVYPAQKKHFHKYRDKVLTLRKETPEDYKKKMDRDREKERGYNMWVYAILEGRKEVERTVFRRRDQEEGFVLIMDSDWGDRKDTKSMHVLAIVENKELMSIRELNRSHVKLLKNIQQTARQTIKKEFGIEPNTYREFFHYPPTFYHLHIHFLALGMGGRSTMVQRCHELNQVIMNLQLCDTYYRDATLTVLRETLQE